jgi:hypothetical protein
MNLLAFARKSWIIFASYHKCMGIDQADRTIFVNNNYSNILWMRK